MADERMDTSGSQSPSNQVDHDESANGGVNRRGSSESQTGNPANPPARPTKRIACILCRRRKLRCDGARPACGTCKRLAHDCVYDEVRRKSGPKRGYVKALEARLHQVETLLKTQENVERDNAFQTATMSSTPPIDPALTTPQPTTADFSLPDTFSVPGTSMPGDNQPNDTPFPWEMIGLGLDEPLPTQDVIDELHQIFFDKIQPSVSMVHRRRYLAAMNLAPSMRPPVCLRYIIWAMAASITDKYDSLHPHLYERARKYIQQDEMKGHGETITTVAHCQTWILIMTYEFKHMYFPRAWVSAGRATRLAQMMGLHRLDGVGLDVKQCIPPPKDWTEREERRRTFWQAFIGDRSASIGTGWPMTIDERDILTNLPAPEDAFDKSKPVPTITLQKALTPSGAASMSSMAGSVLMASMFGQNLLHLHRPTAEDRDDDINGEFWKRHRRIDDTLTSISLNLPDNLRLPAGISDSAAVYMNMCLHTSFICLHQAAIFKAERNKLPSSVATHSKIRCVTAASEITSVMRSISHMDLTAMNCFIPFCLYVASRVFVQYLKARPNDEQMKSSLQFLLAAMKALNRKNPLTESFLAQLDVDLEGSGMGDSMRKSDFNSNKVISEIPRNTDAVGCAPMIEIRQSQNPMPSEFNQDMTGEIPSRQPSHTPGPPFHVGNIRSVDMSLDPTPYSYASGDSTMHLPSRSRAGNSPLFASREHNTPESEAMSQSGGPGSPSNRGGSSHTSFSPQHQGEHLNPLLAHQPQSTYMSTPHTSSAPGDPSSAFYTDEPGFAAMSHSGFFPHHTPDFGMGQREGDNQVGNGGDPNQWGMLGDGSNTASSELPSMDQSWNQMIDGLAAWDNASNIPRYAAQEVQQGGTVP